MSAESNNQGRAFEYVMLTTLLNEIKKIRPAVIEKNSSFDAALRAWNSISNGIQENLRRAAKAAVETIFDLEPLILEDGNDKLTLFIQPDTQGETGDVRDILIVRRDIHWEIGLSLKHNHFAVKHSRLAKKLDFGTSWYGVPCSPRYWNRIAPIFEYLENKKRNGSKWRDLPNKEQDVYIPILQAFIDEVLAANKQDEEVPRKMVEYLLGKYDFYKVISIDSEEKTRLLTFNLRGTLNQAAHNIEPKHIIPITNLPTRIVAMEFKPKSTTTVELYMNNGWQFSFRIHNAATLVETSLKFDIQIIGMPSTIIAISSAWH